MVSKGGSKSGAGEGKKPHVNKPTGKKYKHYTINGSSLVKGKQCVKCGPGIFLANHKNRLCCGKCHYTEFIQK